MSGQRMLAAVMFTDAVAFSSHVGRDEEQALHEIESDFEVMRAFAQQHGGQVLKSMGDGMLLVFPSAQNAVTCALEIQRRLGQKAWNNVSNPLLHRIGIHLCDVLLTEDDAHGDGVNVASRLEREAAPGGIAMSQATYDVVRGRLPIKANFQGEKYLRNIVEPVRIWEIPPVFAPHPDHIEEAQTPRDEWRVKVKPAPSNAPIVAALFFVGACVLLAAGAFWFKTANPAGARPVADVQRQEEPAIEPIAGGDPSPPVIRSQTPRSKPDPKLSEDPDKPDSLFADDQTDLANAYQSMRQQVRGTYDFGSMIAWVAEQPWASQPVGKGVTAYWGRLNSLLQGLEAAVQSKSPTDPMLVESEAGAIRLWPMENGQCGMLLPNGQQEVRTFREFDPAFLQRIAVTAWPSPNAEQSAWIRTFKAEYGL